MLIDGLAAAQCVDSSGEVVDIKGVDDSALEGPDGIPLNLEHQANQVPLGEVVYAHKIFTDADCEDDRQRMFFAKTRKTPCIYVVCRLYDAAGHPEAVKAAATIRDRHARGLPIYCRYSIEGSTVARDPNDRNRITSSIWRALALTYRPCSKVAISGLIADPTPPRGFPAVMAKSEPGASGMSPIGGAVVVAADPFVDSDPTDVRDLAARFAAAAIRKALTAGTPSAAPADLTGGAALQRADVGAVLKQYGLRRRLSRHDFKRFAKSKLPDVSPEFLDHFADVAEHLAVQVRKAEGPVGDEETAADLRLATSDVIHQTDELRKAVDLGAWQPEVYSIKASINGVPRHAGRILVDNGVVHHLEDYHGLLGVPEGPVDAYTAGRIAAWRKPWAVEPHAPGADPTNPANGTDPEPAPSPVEAEPDPVRQAAVFHYCRVGHTQPHVVEFGPEGAALDGAALEPAELALILQNVTDGLATLRYHTRPGDLAKADAPMSRFEVLRRMRDMVAAGQLDPEIERAATHHLVTDPMTGHGNKAAYQDFRDQNRPGVYLSIDGNDFKHLNDVHGHDAGDDAIRAMGEALHHASTHVPTGKVFRPGGDEFVAHFPTFQDAAHFTRRFTDRLDQVPPISGQHRVTASVGFGSDFASADRALQHAKSRKTLNGQRAFPPGRTPHLAHSVILGQEGQIPLHSEIPPVLSPASHVPSTPSKPTEGTPPLP